MSTALKRIAMSVQPSLRGRVFALLVGLTLCACAGATATYWLAQHYLYATDVLRQVNLRQQVAALSLSEQLSGLEADALAARQSDARRTEFAARETAIAKDVQLLRASEPLEAGLEIIDRMDEGVRLQSAALRELVDSQPGEGAFLVAIAARHRQTAQDAARELFDLHTRDADIGVSAMRSLARTATTASLFVIPAGAVLGILLGWVLLRQVLGPIRQLVLGAALGPAHAHAAPGQSEPSAEPEALPPGQSDEVRAVGELVTGLLRDVDETQALLKESREHLMQAEKLALVGRLAAGVAHSVRNPLTSVKMRLFSLERGLDLTPGQKEDFEVISEEIRHLDTIVRNFLEFSRPPKPKLQHMSPSDVVDMTLVLLKHRLETYGVDVRLRREQPLPALDLDPEQLKEVLVNLVLNACDAMGENGRIEIFEHTGFMDPLGRVAVIQLTDSGPGIGPELAERVFQPFFSTKEEGTGLGLAIATRIMEEHGGYLHLKPSERGQGACFVLVLPMREKVWLRS
ncbi:Signal transduction histidine kinase regulating C4-dicarboxylate transport system [Humidesulfovibrio mexicanus]|uniref:histidine kinase n=1 Tax=Humidesulfovibrio mexicanus TaxID=147047 RepID=A0A238ZW37_9BACT|nr:ATP-binding protein [Humidesulfovibrio mexicanus]SNR87098.1 Signal transduction histidine kinase regulating C4-dicarboxylate transport system [Humidesulfovibrio mexicanus]